MNEKNKKRLFPKVSGVNICLGLVVPRKYLLFNICSEVSDAHQNGCFGHRVYNNNYDNNTFFISWGVSKTQGHLIKAIKKTTVDKNREKN